MPMYEYQCQQCGQKVEAIQKVSDPPLTLCPQCEGELKRLFSAPALQFKGSGFHITDYPRPGSGKSEGKESGAGETAKGETTKKDETSKTTTDKTPAGKKPKSS